MKSREARSRRQRRRVRSKYLHHCVVCFANVHAGAWKTQASLLADGVLPGVLQESSEEESSSEEDSSEENSDDEREERLARQREKQEARRQVRCPQP